MGIMVYVLNFFYLGDQVSFLELQEKARALISEWDLDTDNPVLVLLEDFCKEGDRITEEAKRDHEDLIQQVRIFMFILLVIRCGNYCLAGKNEGNKTTEFE